MVNHNKNITRNFFQLGLRLLPPRVYFNYLSCYTDWVSRDCYSRIVHAHSDDDDRVWEARILPCEIESEGSIINIATGRRVNIKCETIICGFPNLIDYENFRDDIIDEVNRLLKIATETAYSEIQPIEKLTIKD